MTILGRIIYNKETAMNLISQISKLFDGTMESSIAILDIEERLVKLGFINWNDVEVAELR